MNMILFFQANPYAYLLSVAILSLFVGSFLNVVIYRLPLILKQQWEDECRLYLGLKPYKNKSISLSLPFSYCPNCKKTLLPWHNIPIISYLFLRGKCVYCQIVISMRYPLVELLTAILSVYVAWKFGVSLECLSALIFTWIIISLTFIDIDHHLLPDQLTFLLLWLGLISSIFNLFCPSQDAIIGGVVGYGILALIQAIFKIFTGKDGMGQGDFKFLAALGTYLGWRMMPSIILLASISGVIITLIQMIVKNQYKSEALPFGPYLAAAGWFALLIEHSFSLGDF